MNSVKQTRFNLSRVAIIGAAALAAWILSQGSGAETSPSGSEKPVLELELARVVLTRAAESRLAIKTSLVDRQSVSRTRRYGAQVIVPLRSSSPPSEPRGPNSAALQYIDLAAPESQADLAQLIDRQLAAEDQLNQARVEREAAELALTRARQILEDSAGSRRAVDEAQARMDLAESRLENAQKRQAFLGRPLDAGLNLETLWVRVPVYAGDYSRIQRDQPGWLKDLSAIDHPSEISITPVKGPASANAKGVTVDLYYEIESGGELFRPGQKVAVDLPLTGSGESLVAPRSAILHDIHGGSWVYVNTGEQTYERKRVRIRYFEEDAAVLDQGPEMGSKVVREGAAELFGIEFGVGK